MKVEVKVTKSFKRQAKKLIKKYASLTDELFELLAILEENPFFGIKLSKNTFKIRLKVKSKGKGKSGGLRTITYVEKELIILKEENKEESIISVSLISIYDKSKVASLSDKEIRLLIENKEY